MKMVKLYMHSTMPLFFLFSQGTTYEVGDIVSVLDRDGGVYYALLRGFLQDQYAEKYAILTWLLPTQSNPGHFDPSIFVLGIRIQQCLCVLF